MTVHIQDGSSGASNYNQLADKPSIGGITLVAGLAASDLGLVEFTEFSTALGTKVDKVAGKGLSTNDFTDGYKTSIERLQTDVDTKLPVDFAEYLVTNIEAGYAENDTDQFNIHGTWVYLDPEQGYPQQTFAYPVPIASDDRAGLMSKSDVARLKANTSTIESLRSQGVYIGVSFGTKTELDQYSIPLAVHVNDWTTVEADETKGGQQTRYIIVNTGSEETPVFVFTFERILASDPVGLASTAVAGLVVGAPDNGSNAGKGYVESDGTISVIGWNALNVSVFNNSENIIAVRSELTNLKNSLPEIYSKMSGKFNPSIEQVLWTDNSNLFL